MARMPSAPVAGGTRRRPLPRPGHPPWSPRPDSRRPRPAAGGRRPFGGAAPADLRGRPPRVSRLRGRDAARRVHHADVRDRPDPNSAPRPPCPRQGAGEVGDRAGRWTDCHPTPFEAPIPEESVCAAPCRPTCTCCRRFPLRAAPCHHRRSSRHRRPRGTPDISRRHQARYARPRSIRSRRWPD